MWRLLAWFPCLQSFVVFVLVPTCDNSLEGRTLSIQNGCQRCICQVRKVADWWNSCNFSVNPSSCEVQYSQVRFLVACVMCWIKREVLFYIDSLTLWLLICSWMGFSLELSIIVLSFASPQSSSWSCKDRIECPPVACDSKDIVFNKNGCCPVCRQQVLGSVKDLCPT